MRVSLAIGCALLLAGCGGDSAARLPEPDVASAITVHHLCAEPDIIGRSTHDVLDDVGRAALALGILTGLVSAG